MRPLFYISVFTAVGLAANINAWAQFHDFEVSLPPAARALCHVTRFPQGWAFPRFDKQVGQRLFFGSPNSDYEFLVEGILGAKFLVAGFTEFVGTNYYTNNRYEIDLSDATAPVLAVGRKVWDAAAVVPLARKSGFPPGTTVPNEKRLEFHGFQFNRTGDIWAQPSGDASRLSPDQAWLVLQSRERESESRPTKVFFDFFNADTGQKLFVIEGSFSSINGGDPDGGVLGKTGWLTERYFICAAWKNHRSLSRL